MFLSIVDGEEKSDVPSYVDVEMVIERGGVRLMAVLGAAFFKQGRLCTSAAGSIELILV